MNKFTVLKDHPESGVEKGLKEDMDDCWEFLKQSKKDMNGQRKPL